MSSQVDRTGCLGSTIKVAAGHYVDLANPDPETIDIKSIAAALSKICRFGGHCPKFYSVAEHCIHATEAAMADGITGDAIMSIFLHDATEAYVGDMVKPLKITMPQYGAAESRLEVAIEKKFNVSFVHHHSVIKKYDRMMLKAEKQHMWPNDSEKWEGFADVSELNVNFKFYGPNAAEVAFLQMFNKLNTVMDNTDWVQLKRLVIKHRNKQDTDEQSFDWNRGFNHCCDWILQEMEEFECSKK